MRYGRTKQIGSKTTHKQGREVERERGRERTEMEGGRHKEYMKHHRGFLPRW